MAISFELDSIATTLEGLEETIINKCIDRAQFKANDPAYQAGTSGFSGESEKSLFDLRLRYQEEMDAQFGRFCVPEERPFTEGLPAARRRVSVGETGLAVTDYNCVRLTPRILDAYLKLVPCLCPAGDDGQYGSGVEHDIYALQAVSRRIHFGAFFVAESKYRSEPAVYQDMIGSGDWDGIMQRLTRREIEERILDRVSEKVEAVQAGINRLVRVYVPAETILTFYRDTIIPLTKQGQLMYFRNRRR